MSRPDFSWKRSVLAGFLCPMTPIAWAVVSLLLGLGAQSAAAGPTFVVNSIADVPAGPNTTDGVCETATGNGVCTLRAAIMEANGTTDAVVRVPAGVYSLTRLPTPGVRPENGDLDVLSRMRIEGDGPSVTVVDGNALMRVFRVSVLPSTDLAEIRGMTIRRGRVSVDFGGGIIQENGRLLLENAHLTGNDVVTAGGGGGIAVLGHSTTIRRSVIEGNTSVVGGGIHAILSAAVTVEDSSISRNRASGPGGGIYSAALVRLERTAVVGNTAFAPVTFDAVGGGIYANGNLFLQNSVVWGNAADRAGAGINIAAPTNGPTELNHVTVTGNVGWQSSGTVGLLERGAGIFVGQSASATLGGSIVTSNLDRDGAGEFTTYQPSDCDGLVVSSDYNIRGTTCPLTGQLAHSLVGTGYDQPAFNGGFFRDIATDSTPADGAIPPSACLDLLGAPLTTDARGHRRKALGCDIGAHDAGARYAAPQLLGVNLVRNGGATGQEFGLAESVANPADVELFQAPYWAQPSGPMVQILYGAPDGYPTQANAPPGSGHKFFAGGVQAVTNAYQSIDVSAIAAQIDAGNLPYEISGSFGGYLTDEDRAGLVVEFDGVGGFLDEFSMGGFSAADRGNQTRLIKAQRTGVLPVGTRFIYLGLSFERFNGAANDGYADGISLTLPEPGLAVGLASTLSTLAGLARRRRRADRASDAPARASIRSRTAECSFSTAAVGVIARRQ